MRRLLTRAAVFTVALVMAVSAVQAQTVDEIVAKNLEAKGGAATLKGTTSVRTVGKGTMQGAEVTITSSSKRPYFVRNEMVVAGQKGSEAPMAGQKLVQGFDGQTLWMAMGEMPPQAVPPGPQVDVLKQTSQIDSPLLDYQSKGTKITLGEPVTEGGKTLHHLVVAPKVGPTLHYFIDASTGLESKMTIDVDAENGQKMKMEMRFSDFKTVEGRTVPFTVTQFVNGAQVMQMKFETIEFNVPIDETIFRMPK